MKKIAVVLAILAAVIAGIQTLNNPVRKVELMMIGNNGQNVIQKVPGRNESFNFANEQDAEKLLTELRSNPQRLGGDVDGLTIIFWGATKGDGRMCLRLQCKNGKWVMDWVNNTTVCVPYAIAYVIVH
jgi:hypothetical protein